jgi:hypothetical protein
MSFGGLKVLTLIYHPLGIYEHFLKIIRTTFNILNKYRKKREREAKSKTAKLGDEKKIE